MWRIILSTCDIILGWLDLDRPRVKNDEQRGKSPGCMGLLIISRSQLLDKFNAISCLEAKKCLLPFGTPLDFFSNACQIVQIRPIKKSRNGGLAKLDCKNMGTNSVIRDCWLHAGLLSEAPPCVCTSIEMGRVVGENYRCCGMPCPSLRCVAISDWTLECVALCAFGMLLSKCTAHWWIALQHSRTFLLRLIKFIGYQITNSSSHWRLRYSQVIHGPCWSRISHIYVCHHCLYRQI